MKALTICQPYAHLIAIGEKQVENRTWATSYRGPLAIHAGKGRGYLGRDDLDLYPEMPFGAIEAVTQLGSVYTLAEIRRLAARYARFQRLLDHDHTEGPVCWVLDNVVALEEPIAIRGERGLWNVPDDIAARLPLIGE